MREFDGITCMYVILIKWLCRAVWVETIHAWYILETPAKEYQEMFAKFVKQAASDV